MKNVKCWCLLVWLFVTGNLEAQTALQNDNIEDFKLLSTTQGSLQRDSLLTEASRLGAIRIATHLLDQGASPGYFSQEGYTSIHYAVFEQHPKLIDLLLGAGADPDIESRDRLKGTPLMYAVSSPDVSISQLLIDHGADVNAVDTNGDHALNWATYSGNVAQMKLLLRSGADLNLKSKHGTAVDVALRLWHADSVVNVFRETGIYEKHKSKVEALIRAVVDNDKSAVVELLEKQVNAGSKDGLGNPLLQIAVQNGNEEITRLLLDAGANPNTQNRVGQTPLAFAARFGYDNLVNLLLERGADVNLTDTHYQLTPLIGAAISGNTDIGSKLLGHGAEIDHIETVNQCSALHWALFYGNNDFIKMLLNKGAAYDMPVLDRRYTAYTLAEYYKNQEIVEVIDSLRRIKHEILGSWRFKEIHYIYKDTTYSVRKAFPGMFMVTPQRYAIMYNPSDKLRQPFVNISQPTDEEMISAFQRIVFNTGKYELTDSLIITTADIARVPGFEGGRQFYRYIIDKNKLELRMVDEIYPNGSRPAWYGKLEILFILLKE
ncbi:Ankyrin [Fulvivirga imtechensis AK7]|uniref:Ankyrin n=1 Tax=Fulvivirga imtechensis AK7 TaxID=1237149 RepID=L8K0E4_9BACT|nr:ankyrin repeat domain-containing protein [Fulvivirga imtechensis]ELR72952.1 Ankyrin [Fulvivirga imtechensis AK7]